MIINIVVLYIPSSSYVIPFTTVTLTQNCIPHPTSNSQSCEFAQETMMVAKEGVSIWRGTGGTEASSLFGSNLEDHFDIWGFHEWGTRIAGWFIMEYSIEVDNEHGYPFFRKPPYIYLCSMFCLGVYSISIGHLRDISTQVLHEYPYYVYPCNSSFIVIYTHLDEVLLKQ